ncbi:MAG: hypothetical protein AABW79_03850 [Nanoarchaeota archaeon]
MSDSLQHLNKSILIILLTILFAKSIYAYELSASPAEISISPSVGEKVCKEISISSSEVVSIDNYWSYKNSRELKDYIYSSKELDITVEIPKEALEELQVCFQIKDNYRYNGIIILQSKTRNIGIGIWVIINPNQENKQEPEKESKSSITTNAISLKSKQQSSKSNYLLIFEFIFILILSAIIIAIYRNQIRKRQTKNLY